MFSDSLSRASGAGARPASAQVRRATCTKNSASTYFAAVKLPKREKENRLEQQRVGSEARLMTAAPKKQPSNSLMKVNNGFEPIQDTNLITFNLGRKYKQTNFKETAREAAIRRRQKLIPTQGDFLDKEHLHDTAIASKQHEFRAVTENKRLKT